MLHPLSSKLPVPDDNDKKKNVNLPVPDDNDKKEDVNLPVPDDNDGKENVNLPVPDDYDKRGCPRVPISFSGMTGRLGNMISTYVNMIALQYKVGHKYHLPQYSNTYSPYNVTKPFLQNIFKNVSFPTANWNWTRLPMDAERSDVMLFNNSRTGLREVDCGLDLRREDNVEPLFSELLQCASNESCEVSKVRKEKREKCGNIQIRV